MTDVLLRPGRWLPHSAARYEAGCRCLSCTTAYQDRAAEALRRVRRPKSTAEHGTLERLRGGCRCQPCRHSRREMTT